jgi:hypothetical protein
MTPVAPETKLTDKQFIDSCACISLATIEERVTSPGNFDHYMTGTADWPPPTFSCSGIMRAAGKCTVP